MPSAYGLVAITWSFTGFAALFSDLGLGAALVQSARLTERDAATAFAINGVSGVVLTLIVVVLRHPLANLFGQPQVATLLAISSLAFTLSFSVVPLAILERQMQFGKVAAIDVDWIDGRVLGEHCLRRARGRRREPGHRTAHHHGADIGGHPRRCSMDTKGLAEPVGCPASSRFQRAPDGFQLPHLLGTQRRQPAARAFCRHDGTRALQPCLHADAAATDPGGWRPGTGPAAPVLEHAGRPRPATPRGDSSRRDDLADRLPCAPWSGRHRP